MTITVTVVVALLTLVTLGYQFNEKDGKLEQGGLLQFNSKPSGANVILDGQKVSGSTQNKASVSQGKHHVEFNKDGYRTWIKDITIHAGQIGWLDYARLIPVDLKTETLREFPKLDGSLFSSGGKYILLQTDNTKPDFVLANMSGDQPSFANVGIPEGIYTNIAGSLTGTYALEGWSSDSKTVLIKHMIDKKTSEWILLNVASPDKSINLSVVYGINPSVVEFASTSSSLLFALSDGMVRRINLDEQTLSRPLADNVASFVVYDSKTIVYVTKPSVPDRAGMSSRSVGYAAINVEMPVVIKTFPADKSVLYAAMARYFDVYYLGIVHGNEFVVLSGSSLPTPDDPGNFKNFDVKDVPADSVSLEVAGPSRFLTAATHSGYFTYDLELQKYTETTWNAQPGKATLQPLHWLDGYMLWSSYGGTLRTYEFDGANQQDLVPVAPGFDVSLDSDGKYLYSVANSDDGTFDLTRTLIRL